jgi:hypothetical protein
LKLTDLVKKESERTKQEISFEVQPEKTKKVFKKERVWLSDEEDRIQTNDVPANKNTVQTHFEHRLNTVSLESNSTLNGVETGSENARSVSKHPFKQSSKGVESTPIEHHLNTIVGKEREFLFFLVQECQNNGSLTTPPLTSDKIKKVLNYSTDGLKTVIYRLSKKGIIERAEKKIGRTGWVSYRISKPLFDDVVREKDTLNGVELVSKHPFKQGQTALYSSIIDPLKEELRTNTIKIPESLKTVISKKEIEDLLSKKLITEEDLAQSIDHFAYDFSNNLVKAKSNPISLFFGLSRSGKVYRSITLIEQENQELRDYEKSLQEVENENKRLKGLDLKAKFDRHLQENPTWLDEVREKHKNLVKSEELLQKVAFQEFSQQVEAE